MKHPQSTTKQRPAKSGDACTKAIVAGGIDTGKDWLDAAIHDVGCKPLRCPNTPEGRAAIVQFFREHKVERVGIEASGGYEFEMVAAMRDDGLPVIVFQPAQVRAYANFLNLRVKTDRIDAALIARCTAVKQTLRACPDRRLEPLAEHLTFIEQIEDDITRLRTRRDRFRNERLLAALKDQIADHKKRLRAELADLRRALRDHADLAKRLDLLVSIDGIGERTALTLVIRMPELGTLTREEASSLAGMAPFTQASGRWEGQAHVKGGRARVGKALFAAAQAAAQRWNKQLVALYQRLVSNGKHHSVAVVACARKLVIYANVVLARQTTWITQN